MGSATVETLSEQQARAELDELLGRLGSIDAARRMSRAGVLTAEEETHLRRAESLAWLLGEQ